MSQHTHMFIMCQFNSSCQCRLLSHEIQANHVLLHVCRTAAAHAKELATLKVEKVTFMVNEPACGLPVQSAVVAS